MPKLDDNTVYLVDGSGYIFRAFFAVRPLSSSKGVPTNAVYGFCTMITKLLRTHKPKYLAIAFDLKEPNFRHKIYEEYKANRLSPPEDLVPQFALIQELVEALNIKRLSKVGFEADDLIATAARLAKNAGHEVVVVTGDKDLMQLVDDKTFLLDELRANKIGVEKFIDAEQVKDSLGVWPNQVCDLLALAGDSSDNIPGVKGIGKKTAAELIEEFGSVEKILELSPLIKQNGRRQKLIDGHDMALLSKKLVGLDYNVELDCDLSDLIFTGINKEKTREFFKELDFNRLLTDQTLFGANPLTPEAAPSKKSNPLIDRSKYHSITNEKDFEALLLKLGDTEKIAIDTETDSIDSMQANLVGISLSWGADRAAYIPLAHKAEVIKDQLDIEIVRAGLNKLFGNPAKKIVAQNAKYDHKVLSLHGFEPFKISGDPMLASYLLFQDQEAHNLDYMSVKYLSHKPISFKEVCLEHEGRKTFADVPLVEATEYAGEDADIALRLENTLLDRLSDSALNQLYYDIELPLESVLSRMEIAGVSIEKSELEKLGAELHSRISSLEKDAHKISQEEFNLASPKQVADILFEKLKLPPVKKTKTGYSTDSSVLEKLQQTHELPKILLEYRMCAKLINTYVDVLPQLVNEKTGRLHTSYNQFVASTGRLSSSDPNLQNIPARTSEGRRIRRAFVARPGYKLISLDYSQVELRLLAFVSKDPLMLDSFAQDQDVHTRTASEIFNLNASLVTREQRNAAKTINFGLLYGMGAHRLSQTLQISRKEAQGFLEKYFEKYAGILEWKNKAIAGARESGEVRTLFGRKRSLPELSSANALVKSRGERMAINTPIQGTAADIIKKAMIDTDKLLSEKFAKSKLIMQVHDELVIEAKEEEADAIAKAVSRIMSHGHGLDLDLKVEFGMANNWDDAH